MYTYCRFYSLAICLSVVAVILDILSLKGLNVWEVLETNEGKLWTNLFQVCYKIEETEKCNSLNEDVATEYGRSLLVVRILVIVTVEQMVTSAVLLIFHVTCAKSCDVIPYISMIQSVIAGVCTLSSLLLYVTEVHQPYFTYGAGFILPSISGGLIVMTTICVIAGKLLVKRTKPYVRQTP